MGDYTQLQIFIHDCPDDQVLALVDVLINYQMQVEWDGPEPERGELHIGTAYTNRSTAGDASQDLAGEIIEAAPGATFTTWTDPAYEWLGVLARYVPALGEHNAECNGEGQAVFSEPEIIEALGRGEQAVRDLVGTAWSEAITFDTTERIIRVEITDED
jgi:hypothetical protein